ncbi:hypothetical protein FQR65_LT00849 [Abscondita terminalis]|nr:hypothetical protein FQR65_LT00849 [Abscondita terminalis]
MTNMLNPKDESHRQKDLEIYQDTKTDCPFLSRDLQNLCCGVESVFLDTPGREEQGCLSGLDGIAKPDDTTDKLQVLTRIEFDESAIR